MGQESCFKPFRHSDGPSALCINKGLHSIALGNQSVITGNCVIESDSNTWELVDSGFNSNHIPVVCRTVVLYI